MSQTKKQVRAYETFLPSVKKNQFRCYSLKSIEDARKFSIATKLAGNDYLIIALKCSQVSQNFLDTMEVVPTQQSPFEEGFNLCHKFCYLKITKNTVRVYRQFKGNLYSKEYSRKQDINLQDINLQDIYLRVLDACLA